jgi:hypothetical protein
MTIVVSVNTLSEVLLLADTRLSGASSNGQVVVQQDVCQKLFAPNQWCMMGFAGQLCMARHLLRGFLGRLRATPKGSPDWLRNDHDVLAFLQQGVESHGKMRIGKSADHQQCKRAVVELVIAWVDHGRDFAGHARSPLDLEKPPWMETITMRSPAFEVRRQPVGVQVIGSGSTVTKAMRQEAFMKIAWHAKDIPFGEMHRAFFTATVTRDLLDEAADPTIGDAYQLAYLDRSGVHLVPYFYWIPVGEAHGTYVAMRIEGGEWIQEHRPTKNKFRIMSPFEFQLKHPDWTRSRSRVFDAKRSLTPNSPGVVADRDGRLVYHLYDPENVHNEVVRSWGPEPLAPITWSEANPRRRKRYRP